MSEENLSEFNKKRKIERGIPLSEDERKFHEDWGEEECIEECRRVAKIAKEDGKRFSRSYFSTVSQISESTWNRYFGTFQEFFRRSGVQLTRQQHALERVIARHASVDHYRKTDAQFEGYKHKYDRGELTGWKRMLACSDLHDIDCDPFYLRVLIDTALRLQPDIICLAGDVFDMPEFSTKYAIDPREFKVVERIRFAHERILRPLREACPDAQIDLICGNHEYRLLKHFEDRSQALRVLMSDWLGTDWAQIFKLDELEINFVCMSSLAAFSNSERAICNEISKNYKIYDNTLTACHFPGEGIQQGFPGFSGHHHRMKVHAEKYKGRILYSHHSGAYNWHEMGCGQKGVEFCDDSRWQLGFLLVDYNPSQPKNIVWQPVGITDIAIVHGMYYVREEFERGNG